jgi:hypothetical protein
MNRLGRGARVVIREKEMDLRHAQDTCDSEPRRVPDRTPHRFGGAPAHVASMPVCHAPGVNSLYDQVV